MKSLVSMLILRRYVRFAIPMQIAAKVHETPIQETDPLPKIEMIGTGTQRVAGRAARQETLLPGRDRFTIGDVWE
jgi:hypothetical protein